MTTPPEHIQSVLDLFGAGRYQQASARAAELPHEFPCDARLHTYLGGTLIQLDRAAEAVDCFQRALSIAPQDKNALYNLGVAQTALGAFHAAADTYTKLLGIHSDHRAALKNLCLTLSEVDDFESRSAADVFRGAYAAFFKRNPHLAVTLARSEELADWCGNNGIEMRTLEMPQDVKVVHPESGAVHTYRTEGVRYVVIPNASFISGWDFVVAPTGQVLNRSGYQTLWAMNEILPHLYNKPSGMVLHPWSADVTFVDADALFVSAPADLQFGHWMLEFLPRLRAWQPGAASPLKLAVPSWIGKHHRDTLAACGVRPEDVVWCDFGKRYAFRALTVVQTGDPYRPGPGLAHFLSEKLGPGRAEPASPRPTRRVFLARSRTSRGRNIANPEALDALLTDMGFESMRRPQVSVREQNEILRDAAIVMTSFGTNKFALFQMRAGTDLVLLCLEHMMGLDTVGYATVVLMCETLGIRLHLLPCRATDGARRDSLYYSDLIVDCDAVRTRLTEIIAYRRHPAS